MEGNLVRCEPRVATLEGEVAQLGSRLVCAQGDLRDLRKSMEYELQKLDAKIERLGIKLDARLEKLNDKLGIAGNAPDLALQLEQRFGSRLEDQ